jgi:hypothetical protein
MEIDSPSKREDDYRPVKRSKPLPSSDVSSMVKYLCKVLSTITYKYEQYQLSEKDTKEKRDFVIRYEAMVETLWKLYMNYGPPIKVIVEGDVISISETLHKEFMWNKMMRQKKFTPNKQNWTRLCSEMEQYFYFFELIPPEITSKILDYLKPMSDDTKALSQVREHLDAFIQDREAWIPYCINLMCNITVALVELGRVEMLFGGGAFGDWIKISIRKSTRQQTIQGHVNVNNEEEEYRIVVGYVSYIYEDEGGENRTELRAMVENAMDILGDGSINKSHDEREKYLWGGVNVDKAIAMIRSVCESAVTLGHPWNKYFRGILSRHKYTYTEQGKKYLTSHFEKFFTLKGIMLNPDLMDNGLMKYQRVDVQYDALKRSNLSMVQCTLISLNSLMRETLSDAGKAIWSRAYDSNPQTSEEKIQLNSSIGWYNPDTSFVRRRIRESKKIIDGVLIDTLIIIDCMSLKTLQFFPGFEAIENGLLPLGIIPEWKYLAYIQNPIGFILGMDDPPEFTRTP